MHDTANDEQANKNGARAPRLASPRHATRRSHCDYDTHAAWSKVCRKPVWGHSYSTVCTASSHSTVAPPTAAAPAAALAAAATRALCLQQKSKVKSEARTGRQAAQRGRGGEQGWVGFRLESQSKKQD